MKRADLPIYIAILLLLLAFLGCSENSPRVSEIWIIEWQDGFQGGKIEVHSEPPWTPELSCISGRQIEVLFTKEKVRLPVTAVVILRKKEIPPTVEKESE
jgi:hypothetical protein